MKAVKINEFGGTDQLKIVDEQIPEVGKDEVLVSIKEAGINPVDIKIREGKIPGMELPRIMGQDFAGVVLQVGEDVTNYHRGDRVAGFANGSYVEFASVSIDKISRIPDDMSFEVAASLPTAGLTAYQAIIEEAKVDEGQRVLIHGAAGGVGSIAVQLAKWKGAYVIANASGEDATYLKSLGVDEVIDHHKDDFSSQIKDIDVVIDLVGGITLDKSFALIRINGVVLTTVELGEVKERPSEVTFIQTMMKQNGGKLSQLLQLVESETIKVKISKVISFQDVQAAHAELTQHHTQGKILLEIAAS